MKKLGIIHSALIALALLFVGKGNSHAQVAYDEIDVNLIKARINAVGPLWFDGDTPVWFEVPQGTGKSTLFASNLWVGGQAVDGSIHLAAERFRTNGADFFSGPVADSVHMVSNQTVFNKIWKLTRTEIDDHIIYWSQPGYQAPADLLAWPGNGDLSKGEAAQLAPYQDLNGNGIYEPNQGEYPIIRGDMAIYSIFNDAAEAHGSSGAQPMGIEVHQMAYAFNCPSIENNTLYLNYRIINRSTSTYTDTYYGMWSDGDLGNPLDDYVGALVEQGAYFFYNGNSIDLDGFGKLGYGANPPIQALAFLGGPKLVADGQDKQPSAQVKGSVNGFGFNDGIPDNERLGMGHFIYHISIPAPVGIPTTGADYYNYLKSHWLDGSPLVYGGSGYAPGGPAPVTDYMHPGQSDPNGYGTGGQPQPVWDETTAGNMPGDRLGLGSFGPSTLSAGEEVELDFAFIYVRDLSATTTEDMIASTVIAIDEIRDDFYNNFDGCEDPSSVIDHTHNNFVSIYPNPSQGIITLESATIQGPIPFKVTDLTGRVVRSGDMTFTRQTLDLSDLKAGVYHLHLNQTETHSIVINPNR